MFSPSLARSASAHPKEFLHLLARLLFFLPTSPHSFYASLLPLLPSRTCGILPHFALTCLERLPDDNCSFPFHCFVAGIDLSSSGGKALFCERNKSFRLVLRVEWSSDLIPVQARKD